MSSFVEGNEEPNWPNYKVNFVNVLGEVSLLFRRFINTTDYRLVLYPLVAFIDFHQRTLN